MEEGVKHGGHRETRRTKTNQTTNHFSAEKDHALGHFS
jgi:hypothetical protein